MSEYAEDAYGANLMSLFRVTLKASCELLSDFYHLFMDVGLHWKTNHDYRVCRSVHNLACFGVNVKNRAGKSRIKTLKNG